MTKSSDHDPSSINGLPRAGIRPVLPSSFDSGTLPISHLLSLQSLLVSSRSEDDGNRQIGRSQGTEVGVNRATLLDIIQRALDIIDAQEEVESKDRCDSNWWLLNIFWKATSFWSNYLDATKNAYLQLKVQKYHKLYVITEKQAHARSNPRIPF